MGPLDKYILKDDALKSTKEGFDLQFQSHWYRSLPLSCMDFNIKLNGKRIDNNKIVVEANGNQYPYADLPDLDKEWLFILDRATLHVSLPGPLESGREYDIEFNLDLYVPYILVGPESNPLLAGSLVQKKLVCQ